MSEAAYWLGYGAGLFVFLAALVVGVAILIDSGRQPK